MKKFDVKKVNRKKAAVIAAVVLAVALLLSELFSLHADTVTVKYVADRETYLSKSTGGYTEAFATKDKKDVKEWIRLFEKIVRKGEKLETRIVSDGFPNYTVEYRQGSLVVQKLVVTPDRVGVYNFLTGSYVLEFEGGNPYYEEMRERMAEHKE